MKDPALRNRITDTRVNNKNDGVMRALELFHMAAEQVPAYQDFLAKHKVAPGKIKNIADFVRYVPLMDKENYLRRYPLPALCVKGSLFANRIISVSSGSSGVPFFWPRGSEQDHEGTEMHSTIYDGIFQMNEQSTLLVICFSMGTWIAGSFTTLSSFGYADKGNPLTTVTPGLERGEAIKSIKGLASYYDQVVIAGYPPFIKDVIEGGRQAGIVWSGLKVRLLMAGEAFSEEWRDYVLQMAGSNNPYFDAVNIYGSADASMLGHETPLSILIRRLYNQHPEAREQVFGRTGLPSIVQYDPTRRYFEEVDGEMILTAMSGIPLIRYNIKDSGGIRSLDEMIDPIRNQVMAEAAKNNISLDNWKRPFIFLNGRKDSTVTIYAVNIYPENIKAALIDQRIAQWVTGRFTMATKNSSDMDQYFEINAELAEGFTADLQHQRLIESVITEKLLSLNAEFYKLCEAIGSKAHPKIYLLPFDDPHHFSRSEVKQKWVKKKA